MAGVHCSFFIFVCVSFRSAHFFRSAPSPLRLHRRSSLLSTSLFSRRFVFFVRSCFSISLPFFLPLFKCFSHSRSSPALSARLSLCFHLNSSFRSGWLSPLVSFFFRLFPVSFSIRLLSSVLAQSSCLSFCLSLFSLFLSSVSILLHPSGETGVEEVEWREVDGEVRNGEGHGGVERVGLGWMSGARVKRGRGETLFGPFSLLICLFLGRFATPDFPLPG